MSNKEYILDSLIDDGECFTQIKEYFDHFIISIEDDELQKLLDDMEREQLIAVSTNWVNEKNEHPYYLTARGKKMWENTNWNDEE